MQARERLREVLAGDRPVTAPVCLDPLGARLIEQYGFRAAYLSGGALGFSLAVSEALLTLTEVADATRRITARSGVPLVVDAGIGFGDAVHAARAVWELEAAGAAAIEIEDQVAPKRAHHHRGHEHLVPLEVMAGKVREAAAARSDPSLVLIARTSAVRNESMDAAVERALAYRDAGADAILLAPRDEAEMERAGREIGAPLVLIAVAGRWSDEQLAAWGFRLVLDPFTGHVLPFEALRDALAHQREHGRPPREPSELMALYREMQAASGIEGLYEIERRTTEQDAVD